MNFRLFSSARLGLIALGLLAGLSAPAAATPLSAASRTPLPAAAADTPPAVLNVNHRRYRCSDGWCGGRHWQGDSWRYRQHWRNNDWRYRKYRHHRRPLYVQPRIYFGAPAYRYVQPRRYYGYRKSSAHIAWCYDRYRSYRQWDNTFQPYHGPRRQCWSPYS